MGLAFLTSLHCPQYMALTLWKTAASPQPRSIRTDHRRCGMNKAQAFAGSSAAFIFDMSWLISMLLRAAPT
ncbi:hypothetical protein BDV11DRAFT_198940 [Aspergillus similis]